MLGAETICLIVCQVQTKGDDGFGRFGLVRASTMVLIHAEQALKVGDEQQDPPAYIVRRDSEIKSIFHSAVAYGDASKTMAKACWPGLPGCLENQHVPKVLKPWRRPILKTTAAKACKTHR